MEKPVQWMTFQELRDELERTRPHWEAVDLDNVLAHGQPLALSEDAHRHPVVADELLRRPGNGWIKIRWSLGDEAAMPPDLVAD